MNQRSFWSRSIIPKEFKNRQIPATISNPLNALMVKVVSRCLSGPRGWLAIRNYFLLFPCPTKFLNEPIHVI